MSQYSITRGLCIELIDEICSSSLWSDLGTLQPNCNPEAGTERRKRANVELSLLNLWVQHAKRLFNDCDGDSLYLVLQLDLKLFLTSPI